MNLQAIYHLLLNSKMKSEFAASHFQFGLWTAADDVQHCLSFITWTLVSHCKAPLFAQ